jgi:Tfp pilus assembly protein PilO
VGTVLTLVNQVAVMAADDLSWPLIARVLVNYLVPFTVSSMAYLAPFRMPARGANPDIP